MQTCTQQHQTFHHAKKHTGSPPKVDCLTLHVYKHLDHDPRPLELINQAGYSDYFGNTCINSEVMHQAPITQLFVNANTYTLLIDHSYGTVDDPMESYLLTSKCKMTEQTNAKLFSKSLLIHKDIQTAAINHGNDDFVIYTFIDIQVNQIVAMYISLKT